MITSRTDALQSERWLSRYVWAALFCCSTAACSGAALPAPRHATGEAARPHGTQLVQIAQLLSERGDRVRAAQYLTAAQKDGVAERVVLPRLLALYAADGQYRLAIAASEDYLRHHPRDSQIRACLAAFYVAIDAMPQALAAYEALLQQSPGDAAAHYALASLLSEAGAQHARADAHYRAYLALEPHGRHAQEARSRLLTVLR